MKNYFLAFVLALLVVLSGATVRGNLAGIGGSPAPIPPMGTVGIGGSPAPIPPMGIGGSPAPIPPMSTMGIGGSPAPIPPMK